MKKKMVVRHRSKAIQKRVFPRKYIGLIAAVFLLLGVTGAYAAYDISQGGWLTSYLGEASSVNKVSTKELKAQKEAQKKANQDAREQVKKDNEAKRNGTYGTTNPSTGGTTTNAPGSCQVVDIVNGCGRNPCKPGQVNKTHISADCKETITCGANNSCSSPTNNGTCTASQTPYKCDAHCGAHGRVVIINQENCGTSFGCTTDPTCP